MTWHWQWLVLNEFLPLTVGSSHAQALLGGDRRIWRHCRTPFIPVEFQGAAYRFGHSQVRPSYRVNFTGAADGGQRFAFVFDASQIGSSDPSDMQGGFAGAGRHVGWPTFFRFDDAERAAFVRPNKLIDTKLSSPLFHLPPKTVRGPEDVLSLPQRNLLRHLTWSLPSGQTIAKALGIPPLSTDQLAELAPIHPNFPRSTPLWYYVLKEAELMAGGAHLGPLGSQLVGGVIVGLMRADENSYLNAARGWTPTLGKRAGTFGDDRPAGLRRRGRDALSGSARTARELRRARKLAEIAARGRLAAADRDRGDLGDVALLGHPDRELRARAELALELRDVPQRRGLGDFAQRAAAAGAGERDAHALRRLDRQQRQVRAGRRHAAARSGSSGTGGSSAAWPALVLADLAPLTSTVLGGGSGTGVTSGAGGGYRLGSGVGVVTG